MKKLTKFKISIKIDSILKGFNFFFNGLLSNDNTSVYKYYLRQNCGGNTEINVNLKMQK